MAGLDDLNPEFTRRLLALQAEARRQGTDIGWGSGSRSVEEQIALRRKNGCPDVWTSPASSCRVPTAIPGRSNHNHGLAMDITGDKAWANANAARFGLHFPVAGEDWHIEMTDDAGSTQDVQGAMQMGAIGFNVDWMGLPGGEQASRDEMLQGYVDSITQAFEQSLPSPAEDPMLGAVEGDEMPSVAQDMSVENAGQLDQPGLPDIMQPQLVDVQGTMQATPGGGGGDVNYEPGGGVGQWAPLVRRALEYVGQPTDDATVQMVLRRMNQESSGNPNAVNNWDSNARRGTPSKGLMQVIQPTFDANVPDELRSRGLTDPFANIVASMRYAMSRYGSLSSAYNRSGGY